MTPELEFDRKSVTVPGPGPLAPGSQNSKDAARSTAQSTAARSTALPNVIRSPAVKTVRFREQRAMRFGGAPGSLGANWGLGPGPQNSKDSRVINCSVDCCTKHYALASSKECEVQGTKAHEI